MSKHRHVYNYCTSIQQPTHGGTPRAKGKRIPPSAASGMMFFGREVLGWSIDIMYCVLLLQLVSTCTECMQQLTITVACIQCMWKHGWSRRT